MACVSRGKIIVEKTRSKIKLNKLKQSYQKTSYLKEDAPELHFGLTQFKSSFALQYFIDWLWSCVHYYLWQNVTICESND